jgi:hypothetical protein
MRRTSEENFRIFRIAKNTSFPLAHKSSNLVTEAFTLAHNEPVSLEAWSGYKPGFG